MKLKHSVCTHMGALQIIFHLPSKIYIYFIRTLKATYIRFRHQSMRIIIQGNKEILRLNYYVGVVFLDKRI